MLSGRQSCSTVCAASTRGRRWHVVKGETRVSAWHQVRRRKQKTECRRALSNDGPELECIEEPAWHEPHSKLNQPASLRASLRIRGWVGWLVILAFTMSPMDHKTRLTVSVLDRLIGVDRDSSEGTAAGRLGGVHELQAAVRGDLVALLNTRRKEHPIPVEYEQCNTSLLVFGLPDFTSLGLRDPGDQRRLGQAIETAIRTFEPRLSAVSVSPEPRNEIDAVLRYRVDALLNIEPAPEPITFDTVLQADTGRFLVAGKRK